jgi:SpoVK/Ycf46/Vps4 family AAA+-type ATPase
LTSDQTTSTEGGKRVVVIAATNTPWMIDSAFLRPGRFDRVVHVGLPSLSDRKSILQLHIEKMRFRDGDDIDTISDLCDELSTLTEGFTGADVAALCRAAAVRALGQGDGISVDANHFKDALKLDVFPSSDNILVKRLKAWRP